MGYEIAGALGVKMASPSREVFVVVGDGSYLMLNSELATSVMLGQKITVVLLDNRGFGCINRLQRGTGNAGFNNLLEDCHGDAPDIDFAAHAKALERTVVQGVVGPQRRLLVGHQLQAIAFVGAFLNFGFGQGVGGNHLQVFGNVGNPLMVVKSRGR